MSANGEGDMGRTKYQSEQWKGSQRDWHGAIGSGEEQPGESASVEREDTQW